MVTAAAVCGRREALAAAAPGACENPRLGSVVDVVSVLARHGCSFVVVGSAARYLLGEDVRPRDVDVVVDSRLANRSPIVTALAELGACVARRGTWVPVADAILLPWEWGWENRSPLGKIDIVSQFIDGTGFDEHDRLASTAVVGHGTRVRCHATRHPT